MCHRDRSSWDGYPLLMGDMVSNGFNDYWLKFKESGSKDPEMDIYSTVEDMIGKINMALDQECFDLRGCDLYNELCEYVSDDLY